MLIEAGILDENGLRAALAEQRRWGGTLGRTLVEMKLVSETELVRALSVQLACQSVDLDKLQIPLQVIELVPGELAQQWNLVPFAQPMKFLDVAMADPTNQGIADELRIRTQLNIRPFIAGPKMIERALSKYYGRGFAPAVHRPDLAVPIDSPDLLPGSSAEMPAQIVAGVPRDVTARDGIRPYPRKTGAPPMTGTPPSGTPTALPPRVPVQLRDAEIAALQERISTLEALLARDEEVLRKLLSLLVEKGVATRDEVLERIK
jgi:type IV pilus assembly protein PilB